MEQRQKRKKVPGNPTRTIDSCKDERFAQIIKNPVYRPVPRKEKKVDIDKRFQGMFKDEQFKLKYKVDKRGRPVETTTDENLKRYYNLNEDDEGGEKTDKKSKKPLTNKDDDDDDDDVSSSEDSDFSAESESGIEGNVEEEDITSVRGPKGKVKLDEVTRKKLRSAEIDFARGEANFVEESSSDDDDSTTDDEENDVPMVHDWGELDKDAPRTEGSSCRLALCNMDWDRVRAVDLMVLLGSFLPPGGVIKSVKIYPSEFGKERMAEEETEGPRELRENSDGTVKIKKEEADDEDDESEMSNDSEEDEDEEGEGSQYHREKLRQYQLNRLKYFYAVAEFDSAEAADKVYSECDGMEYESSAARIDLRFIPDDVTFDDDEPKDVCTIIPDGAKYRPRFFTTTALQQVKVDLTWDETDPLRKELTEKIFDPKEKVDDEDIRAYLATSSSESESEDENNEDIKEEEVSDQENDAEKPVKVKKSKEDAISKYKSLLQSIETTEKKKKDKDMEMEITWGVGLKDKTEKLVKKKLEEEENAKRTPWQEMLDKRKEKRRMRKQERKQQGSGSESGSDSEEQDDTERTDEADQLFSDDDVDVDMNDEFFQSELRDNDIFKNKANKLKKREGKTKKDKGAEKGDKKEGKTNAELELLLMDEDDSKRHFSLKKIIAEENESSKPNKKKKKKRKFGGEAEDKDKRTDDFEINLGDQRFSALFRSHHFNVDPSDPNFKKTKAMDKIIAEKQKRRETGKATEIEGQRKKQLNDGSRNDVSKAVNEVSEDDEGSKAKTERDEINKKAELSYLVKSIKRKTENLKSKKAKRVKSKY